MVSILASIRYTDRGETNDQDHSHASRHLPILWPQEARTQAKTDVYYGPYQLSNWRPKHTMQALNEFPEAADIVEQIEQLVKTREAIKAAP